MDAEKSICVVSAPLLLEDSKLKAEEVANNMDLISEILLRSPAESVLRFKCICTKWCSVISELKFVIRHVQQNPEPSISGLYLCSSQGIYNEDKFVVPVPFGISRKVPTFDFLSCFGCHLKVEDACNGVFLCCVPGKSVIESCYIVCNPTTQKYKLLPDSPAGIFHANIGYNVSTAVYKVVLSRELWNSGWEFHIFSSDTASWKVVRDSMQQTGSWRRTSTVKLDGTIHWMCGFREIFHYKFHVDEERLEAAPVPPRPKILPLGKTRYFGESGGRLLLIQTRLRTALKFRVLEMGKGSSGWTVKYRVNLKDAFPTSCGLIGIDYSVLLVLSGATENDAEIIVAASGKIISYNFKCKTVKFLSRLPPNSEFGGLRAYQYQGSLAPV